VWVPVPPSSFAALAGATVLVNLSASNITIGKAGYRHQLVANQSAKCLAGYLYTAAGTGESTTDLAWDGHAMIYENGQCLAESDRFHLGEQLLWSEIDVQRMVMERMRQTSFAQSKQIHAASLSGFRTVPFALPAPVSNGTVGQLSRTY
jgi:NAD+ synthase (glutamine-hydrolysing)